MDKKLNMPLSEDEIDWLDDFLWNAHEEYEHCMSLETVDGLFAALAVNPKMAHPDEWLKIIFGENFQFESNEEAEDATNFLLRHWNRVNHLIQNRPTSKDAGKVYLPFIFDQGSEPEDEPFAKQWAIGFHVGIDYCNDAWDKAVLEDDDFAQMLAPILLLELGYNPDKDDEVITHEKRQELYTYLPLMVYTFYDYWRKNPVKASSTQRRTTAKIGRNEPCPCGSGKKYKKCCYGKEQPTIH